LVLGPPPFCDNCEEWNGTWTEYFNIDQPGDDIDDCDCELLSTIRENYPDVCEFPIAIDVKLANLSDYYMFDSEFDVSLNGGFRCENSDQQTCEDYKVRFCCPSGKKY